MKAVLDTSVIVAALNDSDPNHVNCRKILLKGREKPGAFSHALSETFSTLTGGRLGFRLCASDTASLLRNFVAPKLTLISLTENNLLDAYAESEARGVRGGAIYDYLHLFAARKAGAIQLHTLNSIDFHAFHRSGDPMIVHP